MKRLLLSAVGVIVVLLLAGEANAAKMIIIWCYRDHAPVGELSPNGRLVKLTSVGPARAWIAGETLRVTVTVIQPQTGAQGIGLHVRAAPTVGPATGSKTTLVNTLPGSPAFQPGPVTATGHAVRLYQGKVVATWTWTSTVTLVQK